MFLIALQCNCLHFQDACQPGRETTFENKYKLKVFSTGHNSVILSVLFYKIESVLLSSRNCQLKAMAIFLWCDCQHHQDPQLRGPNIALYLHLETRPRITSSLSYFPTSFVLVPSLLRVLSIKSFDKWFVSSWSLRCLGGYIRVRIKLLKIVLILKRIA